MKSLTPVSALIALLLAATTAHAQDPEAGSPQAIKDPRAIVVKLPENLHITTLGHMRDHLLALQQITAFLAEHKFTEAADTAEQRLGLSSMQVHGAQDLAPLLPPAMRMLGHQMHQAASDLAVAARDANEDKQLEPVLKSLAAVESSCVSCHSVFRFESIR